MFYLIPPVSEIVHAKGSRVNWPVLNSPAALIYETFFTDLCPGVHEQICPQIVIQNCQ